MAMTTGSVPVETRKWNVCFRHGVFLVRWGRPAGHQTRRADCFRLHTKTSEREPKSEEAAANNSNADVSTLV